MLRITDVETGLYLDLEIPDLVLECLREQIARGSRKKRNAAAFKQRLEFAVELAIGDSVDGSLQPPLPGEQTHVIVAAMNLGVPLPEDALRRRRVLLRFLEEHSAPMPNSAAHFPFTSRR